MTIKLYEMDSYLKEFTATVVDCIQYKDKYGIILNKTAFAPAQGGQYADSGYINNLEVIDIVEENETIHHILNEPIQVGEEVRCMIDWDKRFDVMQQHTGQHILSRAIFNRLNLKTVSFHLGKYYSTIDLEKYVEDEESLWKVEEEANNIVYQNRMLKIIFLTKSELKDNPLIKNLRSNYTDDDIGEELIRIIYIDDYDVAFCCGTHVNYTGEIGLIKIVKNEHYKGKSRLYFLCGKRAFKYFQNYYLILNDVSRKFNISPDDISYKLEKLITDNKNLNKELKKIKTGYMDMLVENLYQDIVNMGKYKLLIRDFKDLEDKYLMPLGYKLIKKNPDLIALLYSVPSKTLIATIGDKVDKNFLYDLMIFKEERNLNGGGSKNFFKFVNLQRNDDKKAVIEFVIKRIKEER